MRSNSARDSETWRCLGRGIRREERKVDLGLLLRGELDLGLLRGILQTLEHHGLARHIDTTVLLEGVDHPVDEDMVDVVSAEVGVAVGGLHLDDRVTDLKDRDVERSAAEVVHGDDLVFVLVQSVGQRGRGRLVDDALDVQTRNLARILGRLTLRVVEVAGTVMTASVTSGHRLSLRFSFGTIAEIRGQGLALQRMRQSALSAGTTS